MNKFKNLAKVLVDRGYDVDIKKYDMYEFATITGKGIFGGFATKHDQNHLYSSYYFNDKICVDNVDCYDKPRKCPLQYFIPETEMEIEHLIDRLEFWGSRKGYEESSDYGYDEGNYID